MARKMTQEQKDKMQAARKAKAEQAKSGNANANQDTRKFKPSKKTEVVTRFYIPKGTAIAAVPALLEDMSNQAKAKGLNPLAVAGTLRVY